MKVNRKSGSSVKDLNTFNVLNNSGYFLQCLQLLMLSYFLSVHFEFTFLHAAIVQSVME